MTSTPQRHRALLNITGWASQRNGKCTVGGIWVQNLPEAYIGKRVTAQLYPKTQFSGQLDGMQDCAKIKAAKTANDQSFEIVARLIRRDHSNQMLTLRLYPSVAKVRPFLLNVCATTSVLQTVDPEWTAIHLKGSLVGMMMVADTAAPSNAPIPEMYDGWVRGRPPRQ